MRKTPKEKRKGIEYFGFVSRLGLGPRVLCLADVKDPKEPGQPPLTKKEKNPTFAHVVAALKQLLPELKHHYDARARQLDIVVKEYRLVMDNAPWHRKKKLRTIIEDLGFKLEPRYPPYSSDLNVVENVWRGIDAIMDQRRIANLQEAKLELKRAYNILLEREENEHKYSGMCENYVHRLDMCVTRNGDLTKY